ncbi:MAG TPA: GcrA family cell cycle regulator [Acidocella sp.]|jgi:GcrA cell cycle regulator|uniref:GcrA family cell cycle regulator n=1 Tax=Acidocella sp. TaxID=50710 RepID=UPI002C121F86|nr:GcrA family cell cycle regulator [Acidocella sp.]HVE20636.1 GcrA family cell cycle regulator [Acidocella sp.]
MNDDSWPDHLVLKLRALWAEGLSSSEIGSRLNKSKNSVVGKAHRLHLPSRPSPIRRSGEARAVKPVKLVTPGQSAKNCAAAVPPSLIVPAVPVVALAPGLVLSGRAVSCQFPIGTPRQPDFRFCEAPSEAGKPYCQDHCAIAYVRAPESERDAA